MELIPGLPNDVALECLIRISFDEFPKAASVCRKWKAVIKQPEFWRRRKASGLNRPVIAMAQCTIVRAFGACELVYKRRLLEPVKGRWYDFPPRSDLVEGMFCSRFSSVVAIAPELAVIGGYDPATRLIMNSVFIYNFLSATWRRGSDMPGDEDRFCFGCAASEEDRMVVVAGGHDTYDEALKSTLAYDVARDKWTALEDLSSGRDYCTCVFHRGKFQVIGGYEEEDTPKDSVETLDLVTRQWSLTDKITDMENIMTMAIYADIGGVIYTLSRSIDVVALEDASATWAQITRIPEKTCNYAYVTGWQGKVIVIGDLENGEAQNAYVVDVKSKKLRKIVIPTEYCGWVESACCIEL